MNRPSVMEQFIKDGVETKGYKLNAESIEKVYDSFKKDSISEGDLVVEFEFSSKGGHFTIRKVEELEDYPGWVQYGDYIGMRCLETTVLIEHPEYQSKKVEPFNRQQPFYIGYGFRSLESEVIDGWDVYHIDNRNSNTMFRTEKFYHNDFWDTYKFTACINEENLQDFIQAILLASDIPDNVADFASRIG